MDYYASEDARRQTAASITENLLRMYPEVAGEARILSSGVLAEDSLLPSIEQLQNPGRIYVSHDIGWLGENSSK